MKIETYGLTETDFIKGRLSTTTPISFDCPKCGMQAGQPCKNRKYFHVARVQARWNKLKDVLEFVSDAPIETQATIDLGNWLNVDSRR